MMKRLSSQEQEIINRILKLRPLFYLDISRLRRFLYSPIRTIIFYFLVLLNQYNLIKVKIKAKTIFGDTIYGYSSASVGPIYYLGFQDPIITIFLIRNLNKGDVFLDIGSNVGYYSLLAGNLVSSTGSVYSFEPTPQVYSLLKINTKKFPNIYTNQLALSNRAEVIDFIDYGIRFSVFNSLFKREVNFLKNKGEVIKIKTDVLDKFCIKRNIVPTIIKLDAEGSESIILEGSNLIIFKHRPLIILEVGGKEEWKQNNQKSLNFLLDRKYKIFELDADANFVPHKLREIYEYGNLILIPEEKLKLVL